MAKYHNIKVVDPVHGTFDSKAEYARWVQLRLMEKVGAIKQLERQVPFVLNTPDTRGKIVSIGKYVADFTYTNDEGLVVEDVKGVITALFRWKARHFLIQYGFPITIVGHVKKKRRAVRNSERGKRK